MKRTSVALASSAAVLVALAVVTLASRGDSSDRTAAAFETGDVGRTLFLTILGVAFAIAAALAAWVLWPDESGPRKPPPPAWWLPYVALAALILLLSFFAPERRAQTPGPRDPSSTEPAGPEEEAGPDGERLAGRASPTASLTLVAVVVVALLGFTVVLRARRDHADVDGGTDDGDASAPASLPQEVAAALDAGDLEAAIATIAAEGDPRRATLLAYAVLEAQLARTPAARPSTATPHEWLRTIRRAYQSDAPKIVEAARTLTTLYERARFADHPMSDGDRDLAVAALRALARPDRVSRPPAQDEATA